MAEPRTLFDILLCRLEVILSERKALVSQLGNVLSEQSPADGTIVISQNQGRGLDQMVLGEESLQREMRRTEHTFVLQCQSDPTTPTGWIFTNLKWSTLTGSRQEAEQEDDSQKEEEEEAAATLQEFPPVNLVMSNSSVSNDNLQQEATTQPLEEGGCFAKDKELFEAVAETNVQDPLWLATEVLEVNDGELEEEAQDWPTPDTLVALVQSDDEIPLVIDLIEDPIEI